MPEAAGASPLIVAIDQGTSSTKVVVVDERGAIVASASVALAQQHPQPGWVEQDAEEILASVISATERAIEGGADRVVGIGISSQRESALAWETATGRALGPVLGWQDRRTVAAAGVLLDAGHGDTVRRISGLPLDPMFSALKFAWLLDDIDPDRVRADAGEITLGTVDAWLLARLAGERRIEVGNASRTQLLSIDTAEWDDTLLELFRIPRSALPAVVASTEPSAPVTAIAGLPSGTRVLAVLGDSHAALYGHGARVPGAVKVTYGTGSSVMGLELDGADAVPGLVRTIAWSRGAPVRAFEGNILSTGATLVWLAGVLGATATELADLAQTARDDHGLSLVPAFSGLGAPWWDESARGLIIGLSLGSSREEIARAAVESIALQIEDVLAAADGATGARIGTILADGGPSSNDWLMQLQADLSDRGVVRSAVAELSALGVAHLTGTVAGVWTDDDVLRLERSTRAFDPSAPTDVVLSTRARWTDAVARSRYLPAHADPTLPVPLLSSES
jgi:glycerol kinase